MKAEHGKQAEKGNEQIPLWHHQQRIHYAPGRLVQRLERRQSPDAMIDAVRPPPHIRNSINPPGPFEMARPIVFFRPFPCQKSLGFSVALLLAQIGANRIAAMMPDHRGRTETEGPAMRLQTPAHVHIVAGDTELRIKSADRLQAGPAEGHVAAGY